MADAPYWDPYNDEIRRSPYDAWRRLRDEAPVYYNERYDFYALSRFDDVLQASLDVPRFSSAYGITLDMIGTEPDPPSMIMMDPPEHDALRKIVGRWFTPRSLGRLEERIRELCAGYLDPFVGSDGFDYVLEFSARLPVMVISSLLGFPKEDHDDLRQWTDLQLVRSEEQLGRSEEALAASQQLHAYYWEAIQQRRANPRDDMVSELIAAEFEDVDGTVRQMTDIEIMGMMVLINVAGNETVARLLGWAATIFPSYPGEAAKLIDDPSLYPNAVEELLRFEAPSPTQGRYVTEESTLHGVTIPEGSKLLLLTGSAGRDERHYPDADRFDVSRSFDRHLALGYGAHYCLGAALARLEGRIGLEETLKRFPEWSVDLDQVEYVQTNTVRGPASCPIQL